MSTKQRREFEKNDRRLQDDENLKLARAFAKKIALDEKELIILLSLLGNGKTSNVRLAERLGLSDGNAAAYHIKLLAKRAVLTRYTVQIDWKKIGFPADFVIIAESDEKRALLALERHLTLLQDYYQKRFGNVLLLPTPSGCVLLRDISHCYGDKTMVIMAGSGTSDLDIAFFRENYLARAFEGIRTTLMTTRYRTVDNCVVQRDVLDTLSAIFEVKNASEEEISEIREHLKPMIG
ncbi:MAG: winged helix-turn-helix transcriptional regulator [Halobacteriota archaeon]